LEFLNDVVGKDHKATSEIVKSAVNLGKIVP